MKKKMVFGLVVSMLFITNVYAHPGRTDSSGCHTCKTNCSKWGLEDGEYHCHNGGTYTNSKGQKFNSDGTEIVEINDASNTTINSDNSSNVSESNNSFNNNTSSSSDKNSDSSNTNISNSTSTNNTTSSNSNSNKSESTKKEEIKSNDNTLKKVIINDEIYEDFENIVHTTNNETVNIEVFTNDDKASYEIQGLDFLNVGENYINIVVTAEDETVKTYNILIIRKKTLSSEVGVNIIIDGENVVFENYKAIIYIDSSVTKASIDYALNDENATVEMNEISELEIGDNILNIKVTAEDGTTQDYEIIIHRYSKTEDVIYTILSIGLIGVMGYGVYFIIKKIKNKLVSKEK